MSTVDVTEIKQLPVADRLSVIEDIWDSIAGESAQLEVPQWHREVLRQRLAAYQGNRAEGTPWPEVRRRIERSRKSKS
ncbi:MAG: addiction module protein [Pyrinomonadaceae bacterium]